MARKQKSTVKSEKSVAHHRCIMVVSAHPDDAELALGASIAQWSASGIKVVVVDLTNGEPTPFGTVRRRASEASTASSILKVSARRCLGLKNRELRDSIAAQRSLAAVIREFKPDILFTHYWSDVHPDHVAACQITEGARFQAKLSKTNIRGEPYMTPQIFYYASIHIRLQALPSIILDGSQGREKKLAAIQAYPSQFIDNARNSGVIARVMTDGDYWGNQIGTDFGEPIYSKEPIGINPMDLMR